MLISAKVFLVNILCSFMPCEPSYGKPKVQQQQHHQQYLTQAVVPDQDHDEELTLADEEDDTFGYPYPSTSPITDYGTPQVAIPQYQIPSDEPQIAIPQYEVPPEPATTAYSIPTPVPIPKSSALKYGPPKPHYAPPKQQYGPPNAQYGPPRQQYTASNGPSQTYGAPTRNGHGKSVRKAGPGPGGPRHVRMNNGKSKNGNVRFNPQSLIVDTVSGKVEGYVMTIMNGRRIFAFEGIPYAEPPTGKLRFRAPVRKPPWRGILKTKSAGPVCLQVHLRKLGRIVGNEDCLTVNVYTPILPSPENKYASNLPVIVWIHGGGFFYGSGSEYGPSYLLKEDVILVTINFRQGALGFLSTGDSHAPGNYGLKDQAMAILWTSENIGHFGGDASKVTLMGQSAGGAAVHLHMMSNMTQHLFHGAVSQSATAFNHWALSPHKKATRLARQLAKRLDCPLKRGSRRMVNCMRNADPNFLVYHQQRLHDLFVFPPVLFAPVVEPDLEGAFLTETPENLYRTHRVAPIPFIIGQTTEEADSVLILINSLGFTKFLVRNWRAYAPYILDYDYIASNSSAITEQIKQYYMGSRSPTTAGLRELSDIASDRYFRTGIHKGIASHAQIAPTYALLFGVKSEIGFASNWGMDQNKWGVGHGEDNAYIFNASLYFRPLEPGRQSFEISKMLTNILANFARNKYPNLMGKGKEPIHIWDPVDSLTNIRMLQMDNKKIHMVSEPRTDAIHFWESLGLADTTPPVLFNPNFYSVTSVRAVTATSPKLNEIEDSGASASDPIPSPTRSFKAQPVVVVRNANHTETKTMHFYNKFISMSRDETRKMPPVNIAQNYRTHPIPILPTSTTIPILKRK